MDIRRTHQSASTVGAYLKSRATSSGASHLGPATSDVISLGSTGFATPVVAGTVAAMLSANPRLDAEDIRDILRNTSSASSSDGTPILNPQAAVSQAAKSAEGPAGPGAGATGFGTSAWRGGDAGSQHNPTTLVVF